MKKNLLFISICLLSGETYTADASNNTMTSFSSLYPEAELSTGEFLRSEHKANYHNFDISLENQIKLAKAGIENITEFIEKLRGEKKEFHLVEFKKLFPINPEDSPKKVAAILAKLQKEEETRLKNLEEKLKQILPHVKITKEKTLSPSSLRREKATALRKNKTKLSMQLSMSMLFNMKQLLNHHNY